VEQFHHHLTVSNSIYRIVDTDESLTATIP
jgi:hypothetical protein